MSADQHLWFRNANSTIQSFKLHGLVYVIPRRKPEDRFSRIMAHLRNVEYSKVDVIKQNEPHTRSDTNRAVQAQKMARDWKFWI